MTDASIDVGAQVRRSSLLSQDEHTRKRNRSETRFRAYGLTAITVAILLLAILLVSIFSNGLSAFRQTNISFSLELPADTLDKAGNRNAEEMKAVTTVGYSKVIAAGFVDALAANGVETVGLKPKQILGMLSESAPNSVRDRVLANPSLIGTTIQVTLLANSRIDGYFKGRVTAETAALDAKISPQ
ncbi:MAG: DUF3333 domain-containing protein, partial [Paracoccaceae bacterium]